MRTRLLLLVAFCLTACSAEGSPTPNPTKALFQDDFSQDKLLWDEFSETDGQAHIADGLMTISVSAPWSVAFSMAAINVSDFDVTVNAVLETGEAANSYGILFRYVDERNFYRLDFTGDGLWGVSRRRNDQWISLIELELSPAIRTELGSTNTLRIIGKDKDFTFYSNGIVLGAISDNNLPVGRLGLFASTFDASTIQVHFDDLTVIQP